MKVRIKFVLDKGCPKLWASRIVDKKLQKICNFHIVDYSNVVFDGRTKTCELDYVDEQKYWNCVLKAEQYLNNLGLFCHIIEWRIIQSAELTLIRKLKHCLSPTIGVVA